MSEHEFWQNRWTTGQIGFHEGTPNAYLARHRSHLGGRSTGPGSVLVPLCGKSVDMRFLAELGHRVVGCELVDQAAAAFFDEAGVEPARSQSADYDVREAAFGGKGGSVRILTGDALTLATEVTGPIDAVFDRAALIALPTELRAPYVARVLGLLRAGAPILLVTLEHDAGSGPPHSVPEDVVHALYAERADVKLLERRDVAAESPHILQKGATHVHEAAYLVTVR